MVPPETDRSRPTPGLATHTSCRTALTKCPCHKQTGTTYADNGATLPQHRPLLPPLHHCIHRHPLHCVYLQIAEIFCGASSSHVHPSPSPGDDADEDDGTPTPRPPLPSNPRQIWESRPATPPYARRTHAPLDPTNTADAPRPPHPPRLGHTGRAELIHVSPHRHSYPVPAPWQAAFNNSFTGNSFYFLQQADLSRFRHVLRLHVLACGIWRCAFYLYG
ncbi:hypothetical protein C8J57DRAFT_1733495 [Mycena rebaudengoi]|nr:hypothetical protein C8J57DRAFT_1733495 [Mycena rebaudengoi]